MVRKFVKHFYTKFAVIFKESFYYFEFEKRKFVLARIPRFIAQYSVLVTHRSILFVFLLEIIFEIHLIKLKWRFIYFWL